MAAMSALVSSKAVHFEFWDKFQRLAESRVRECNALAGERLWQTTAAPGAAPLFRVQSTTLPGDSIECLFDYDAGILTCRFGPALQAATLEFQLTGETVDALRQGGGDFTLEQSLTLVLDELVSFCKQTEG